MEKPTFDTAAEAQNEQEQPQEKGFFEKAANKLKTTVGLGALIATLGMSEGVASETPAQENKKPEASLVESEVKIDESKLTESSKWSSEVIGAAQEELGQLKTKEDANWFLRSHFGGLVGEFYIPTKGNLKEGSYGTKIRQYSDEDLKLLLKNTRTMEGIIDELNTKFGGVEDYAGRKEQLKDMVTKLEYNSTYEAKKKREMIDKASKILEEYGKK